MMQMILGPADEPLTLDEAKAFLRIDHAAEDAVVAALLRAARQMVESTTGRLLLWQNWRLTLDAWPASGVVLAPLAPVAALLEARLVQADGSVQMLADDLFTVQAQRTPGMIQVDRTRVPAPGRARGGIELDLRFGYGASGAAVPGDLLQAVRLLLAHFFEHRDQTPGEGAVPATLDALLRPYRRVRL